MFAISFDFNIKWYLFWLYILFCSKHCDTSSFSFIKLIILILKFLSNLISLISNNLDEIKLKRTNILLFFEVIEISEIVCIIYINSHPLLFLKGVMILNFCTKLWVQVVFNDLGSVDFFIVSSFFNIQYTKWITFRFYVHVWKVLTFKFQNKLFVTYFVFNSEKIIIGYFITVSLCQKIEMVRTNVFIFNFFSFWKICG